MIELCSEHLSVWCIWLYVLVMSQMHFRVNPHSIVAYSCRFTLKRIYDVTRTYSIYPLLLAKKWIKGRIRKLDVVSVKNYPTAFYSTLPFITLLVGVGLQWNYTIFLSTVKLPKKVVASHLVDWIDQVSQSSPHDGATF